MIRSLTAEETTTLEALITQALSEDVGDGDHSTLATIPAHVQGMAACKVKDSGILAGMEVARRIFSRSEAPVAFTQLVADGDAVYPGLIAFTVAGPVRTLLTYERLVLNIMQRMSGIATQTHHAAKLIAHTPCKLLDTRKTTPLNRLLEKWAVRIGGGMNHRIGLYDMIMIKDNHIDHAGGIEKALRAVQAYQLAQGKNLQVEIETRNLHEVETVLLVQAAGVPVHRIMLDNMGIDTLLQAVKRIGGACQTEASGGITLDNIVPVAETGVDFISMGALTHTFRSLNISLKAVNSKV